ncbi:MAG: hypothetical protein JW940_12735 [Polyangiaceae bacterium]|nr:hypothetical protein [Polyangiaceae bacterium]
MRNRVEVWSGLIGLVAAVLGSLPVRAQTWTERNQGKLRPPARAGHAMAYDTARQRVVLFGGGDGGWLGDTWEWDGGAWTQCTPATSPPKRHSHAMAYDAARKRVILFGGVQLSTPYILADTWEWDGNTWLQRTPAVSPPARFGHAMAYDSARQHTVLFAGVRGTADDTWAWDGNIWSQHSPVTRPLPRAQHVLAHDSSRHRTVLFGGSTSLGTSGDTWEWDGKNWSQCMPSSNPIGRYLHAMVYDSARQRAVLFGGANPTMLNDTWEWDGSNWTWRPLPSSPSVRMAHAMAYDSARQRVVLFGGEVFTTLPDNETWEYGFPGTVAVSGTARPGATVSLVLTAANDAGLFYQAGASLGTGPIMVDIRQIGLSPDALLQVSVGNRWPWIFQGYRGVLDSRGQAQAVVKIPNHAALVGTRFHTAFLTIDRPAPSGIRSISTTAAFTITT